MVLLVSEQNIINLALAIVMGLASAVFRFWVKDEAAFRKEIKRRFDDAGRESSRWSSKVQALMLLEGTLRLAINEAATEARHGAVNQITPKLAALDLDKMDSQLHDEQLGDLRRRIEALERRRGDLAMS